jgi:hypothetical protein
MKEARESLVEKEDPPFKITIMPIFYSSIY